MEPKMLTQIMESVSGSDALKAEYEDKEEAKGRAEEASQQAFKGHKRADQAKKAKGKEKAEAEEFLRAQREVEGLRQQRVLVELYHLGRDQGSVGEQLAGARRKLAEVKKSHEQSGAQRPPTADSPFPRSTLFCGVPPSGAETAPHSTPHKRNAPRLPSPPLPSPDTLLLHISPPFSSHTPLLPYSPLLCRFEGVRREEARSPGAEGGEQRREGFVQEEGGRLGPGGAREAAAPRRGEAAEGP